LSAQTLKEQVDAFTDTRRLSIAHPLQRYAASTSFNNLPRHAIMHWRGLLQPSSGAVNGLWKIDERLLPGVPPGSRKSEFEPRHAAILCHCKPLDDSKEPVGSENRHSDVPDRWDIYLLMTHQYEAIAFTGKTLASIIRRTAATYQTILKLRDWEANADGGLYRRSRVKSQLRRSLGRTAYSYEIERAHAKTALSHLGLKLPDKPKARRQRWPDLLRELGFSVEVTDEVEPTKHRAMSSKMINDYRQRYPDRRVYA